MTATIKTGHLTSMSLGKLNKALDKKYNWNKEIGVASHRELIERGFFGGKHTSEPHYNRIKFNRMNHAEQKAYEERLAKTKVYSLEISNDSSCSYSVPKMIYDAVEFQNTGEEAITAVA